MDPCQLIKTEPQFGFIIVAASTDMTWIMHHALNEAPR